jgi:hypothetical protein
MLHACKTVCCPWQAGAMAHPGAVATPTCALKTNGPVDQPRSVGLLLNCILKALLQVPSPLGAPQAFSTGNPPIAR